MELITICSIILTVGVFYATRRIAQRFPSPLTTPVFLSTIIVMTVLLLCGITYEQYGVAKKIMTYLLGPATVALGVPLYVNRKIIFKNFVPLVIGLVVGSLSTIISALLLAKPFQFSKVLFASISIKSITIPVASEVSKIIGGDELLVGAFVMITGMCGAMLGPWLLDLLRISHPVARGLSIGAIAHGIGTAEIAREGQIQGAVSGVAMALAAIVTSIVIPIIFPFFS